jgi:radical SAM protein with 4Fe4S-binding SPASM domain
LLEKEEIEHYIRVSFWEGNLAHLSEFDDIDTPLVLFPRIDKPPLHPNLTSKLFEEVMKHEDWVLALPNFMQYLNKPGRCKAATERINVLFDGSITPCNLDLDYHLGRIGDDPLSIKENIDTFVMANKTIPSDCVGCKNMEICRGSCYAAHVSPGCPLKYNFSLNDFMVRYNLDGGLVKKQVGKMTNFMKRMLVC